MPLAHPITRPPTPRQLSILSYLQTLPHFPSTRTLQQAFGFKSQNAVVCHLNALVRRKLLIHKKGGYSLPTQN